MKNLLHPLFLLAIVASSCTTNPSIEQDTPVVSSTVIEEAPLVTTRRAKDIEGYKIRVAETKYADSNIIIRYDSTVIETYNNVIPDDTVYRYVQYKGIGKVLINK